MADVELVIKIPEEIYQHYKKVWQKRRGSIPESCIAFGTPLPKGHGRIGDLDELEHRISNFVEHDANITDEYTVIRQRFIVDGIRQTQTLIEADKTESDEDI